MLTGRLAHIITTSLLFMFAAAARADVDIRQLIDEAGLEVGPVAMRDRPQWRKPKKIVVSRQWTAGADFSGVAPGIRIVFAASARNARKHMTDADALIGYCDASLLAAGEQLQWVQILEAGAENCLAADAFADGRVVLTNMQKISAPVIAEHAVALSLSLSRGIGEFSKAMPAGPWNRRPPGVSMRSIDGKVMLVAGLGGIGTEVARRAAALGMTVYATRNSSRSGPDFVKYVGLPDELFDLAADADIVVNALPLTPATTALFNDAFFDAVKPGALFISVGRGGSVVTADLVNALRDGRIGGAGLDVTDPEPLPRSHPLWTMQNVIITPHVAISASETERYLALLRENLRRFVTGDTLLNVVDVERGY